MSEIYHRSFSQLFSDAIFFERLARREADLTNQRRYVRSSILFSTLTLESAANCCIHNFQLNAKLLDDIDKMPFLSKFDLFAAHGFKKNIDHGRSEVQKIIELKKIRDSLVHPKVTKSKLGKLAKDERSFITVGFGAKFSVKPKSATGIVDKYSLLSHRDCFSAIKSIVEFYNYYFDEILNMEKRLVFGILNDSFKYKGMYAISYPPELFNELDYIKSMGVNIKFWLDRP